MSDSSGPERSYRVVLNHEEQYSIWPADQDIPAGWRAEGTSGTKATCLERVEQVWTDMRPRSLRESVDG
ncbi:MbtH family protein [Jatrophihabitans sp.]|jgi:MbtH protein|uniref:MbtH family protein n=1 Tax=Jatrophihabitans sp. TaxID=1932789 RepID=UPI002EF44029